MVKVLFLTYPRIGLNRGGLQVQIEKTAEELTKLGVEIVLYDPWKNQIEEVDICHVFSIDGSMWLHVQRAAERGKAVVVSPVFNCFANKAWQMAMKVRLSQYVPGVLSDLVRARAILIASDRVLALNESERKVLVKNFRIDPKRCLAVPNGINKRLLAGDPKLIREKLCVRDFVLQVGSIEPRKNQLTLIRAMADLPYSLVIVGQVATGNENYIRKCQEAAGKNVIFTGQIPYDDPLLASAYAAAKLFVLPSYSEVMPLTLYEAAIAGCKVIASKNFPVADEIAQYVPRFDSDKPRKLADLIDKEMRTLVNKKLTQAAQGMPSWEDVAGQIYEVYKKVCSEKANSL